MMTADEWAGPAHEHRARRRHCSGHALRRARPRRPPPRLLRGPHRPPDPCHGVHRHPRRGPRRAGRSQPHRTAPGPEADQQHRQQDTPTADARVPVAAPHPRLETTGGRPRSGTATRPASPVSTP
jgi:hypothetical protein